MRQTDRLSRFLLALTAIHLSALGGETPSYYQKRATWPATMLASREALMQQTQEAKRAVALPDLGASDFTLAAWVKTDASGGAIVAKAPAGGQWVPQGKALFLRGGVPAFDVGWVGAVRASKTVNDDTWHHVALAGRSPLAFYVDGVPSGSGNLELESDPAGTVAKIGYCSTNFPRPSGFKGLIDEVCIYNRRLPAADIQRIAGGAAPPKQGLAGCWTFENGAADSSGNGNDGSIRGAAPAAGKTGTALRFSGKDVVMLPGSRGAAAANELWTLVARDFTDPKARAEMERERRDGIWNQDWRPGTFAELAARYAAACTDEYQRAEADRLARKATSAESLWKVRALYHAPPPLRFPDPLPIDKDPALAGWWTFDEESGRTAKDSSRHGRHGRLPEGRSFAGDSVSGKRGRALKLHGGNGVVITGYKGVTGTAPRTVSLWVKTKSPRGELAVWGAEGMGTMWSFCFIRGRGGLRPGAGYLYMRDELTDDEWHHVAIVMEEAGTPNLHDDVLLYRDGEPATIHDIGLLDLAPLDTGTDLDVRIGPGFTGCLDDVRIYERALSVEEIQSLFTVKTRPVE
jgi:hypothetical protein